MKKELYRDKRVRVLSGYYQGQHGTVTHLNGDAADVTYPDGFDTSDDDEVWIAFDSGRGAWIDANEILIVG